MEEFALIKSRVNLNRVNLGIALISDLKVSTLSFSRPMLTPVKDFLLSSLLISLETSSIFKS